MKMKNLPQPVDTAIRMRLRSIYLKGHQDGMIKMSDLSWEDKMVNEIHEVFHNWKKEI